MEPRAPRFREGGVGDLAGQRVLEGEFALAFERRDRSPADEVALLERSEVRVSSPDELAHGAWPEHAPDHRGRLQPVLLGGIEEVDPRSDHRLHGVGDGVADWELERLPRAVVAPEDARVDEAADELLDEERVSFRAGHDHVSHGAG